MATPVAAECPDPHKPDPVDDVALRQLEKELVIALATNSAEAVAGGAADVHLRAYVDYLRSLECPPEHVVIRVKRLLLRATRGMPNRTEANQICESIVLQAIRVYFER
jgi:hypothetical protein